MAVQKQNIKNPLLLLLTAAIWGVAFVAQSVGSKYVDAFTFNSIRFLMGGVVLLPLIVLLEKREYTHTKKGSFHAVTKTEIRGGVLCGVFLFAASNVQQLGIRYTTVGRAGFITALYVVLVPVFGLFLKKKVAPVIWISVVMSVIGLYLLCMKEGDASGLGFGDIMQVICAVIFAFHILAIDYFSPRARGTVISCIQFLVAGGLSLIPALIMEHPQMEAIWAARTALLYAGILSCGVAYTLQVVAQKGVNPTVASLIMCLESVISVLAGWVILGEALSLRELMGCGLMFFAIIMAQLLPGHRVTSGKMPVTQEASVSQQGTASVKMPVTGEMPVRNPGSASVKMPVTGEIPVRNLGTAPAKMSAQEYGERQEKHGVDCL